MNKVIVPKYAKATVDKKLLCLVCGVVVKNITMWSMKHIKSEEHIKKEIDKNKKNIDNLKNESIESNKIDNKQIEKYINEFLSLENPTRELIINLVEKIYIYQDKTIDIIFTFKNVT